MRKRSRLRPIILTGTALALLLWGGYCYLTRPGALRARLVGLFERFDLCVVHIGEVSFSPWTGLEVQDMQVAAAERSPLAGRARVPNPPVLLRVPRMHLSVNPWTLLLGRFQPRAVELDNPAIAVIWPETHASGPRERPQANRLATPHDTPAGLPRLRINQADIEVFVVQNGRLRLQRRWVADGSGAVVGGDGSEPRAYVLRLDQVAGPASAKHAQEPSLAEIRWQSGQLIAMLGWVDLEFVQSLLPAQWMPLARRLHLSGHARAQRLLFEQGAITSVEVHFDELHFCVPIESDMDETPDERFAQVTDAAGVLSYVAKAPSESDAASTRRGDLRLHVSGRLNGAATEFSLALFDADYVAQDDDSRQVGTLGIKGLRTGRYEVGLRVAELALPTAAQHPRFISSEHLPSGVRTFFRQHDAEGLVNLQLDVWRGPGAAGASSNETRTTADAAGEGIVHYRGELEAVGASYRYFRFPYRVEDAHGLVQFSNDGILLEGLHGRHGVGRIRVDGCVTSTKSWTGFELSVRGHSVATDPDLYAALPPKYRRFWENAAPLGLCDVQTTFRREHGSAETGALDTAVRVDARLLSGSLGLLDGRRLENAEGLIHIADGTVALDDLYGYLEGALVRVNGSLSLAAEDAPPRYDLHVEAANARVQRTSVVRDGQGRPTGEIRFQGVGDIWGQLRSGDDAQNQCSIRVTDGVLMGFDEGAPWAQAQGWISFRGDEQRILSFTARRDDGQLQVAGTLPAQLGLDRPIRLDLEADDADFKRLLRQLVPGRWSNIREALGLAGRGRLTARFYARVAQGARQKQAAQIQLEAERMRPTALPLDLHDIKARLTLHAEGFDLHGAEARYGEAGHVVVSGHGGWADGNTWSDMQVEARELELAPDLVQAMPGPLASLLKRLAAQGRIELALDQVLVSGSRQRAWDMVGAVRLKGAALNVVVPLSDFDGELSGRCEIHPDGQLALQADFAIDRGQLASRPIERWEGRLSCLPGRRRLYLEDARGRLCDGEVVGFGVIDLESSAYELSFTLHDLSLHEFLQREANQSGQALPGRLDGHIFVRGDLDDAGQRSGGGELRLRGTSLLSSPVTASLVEVSQQQRRAISDEVEHAELRFVWEGPELKFSRVDIHSRDLRLIGMGHWNMRSDAISMTLLGATPEDAPRLFLLTDLLETAGQELMQYRVDGTAAKPHVTIEPLHNLTEPLRKLLKGNSE